MVTRKAFIAVILLIVVLLAVLLTGCKGAQEAAVEQVEKIEQKADTAAREANLRSIDTAVQMYYTQEGVYPSTIQQLVPTYFKRVPTDSAGGTYYLVKEGGAVKAAVK